MVNVIYIDALKPQGANTENYKMKQIFAHFHKLLPLPLGYQIWYTIDNSNK